VVSWGYGVETARRRKVFRETALGFPGISFSE
jgi:hypothetical protein